ncbi:transcription factor HIVEP2 [Xenopus tropicalis]|uniref:Human immunodeficiency virus type I enhancer-binding protein 2 n=1 Tax=Xenopus tropicalis TaxID=8364 RepID=F6UB72_XENTR|nr:transcription factor HIVEP2 [Xenopus tropicalis]XP_004914662.1 transcription factor HIVEP2 [Xenopus tropicalis]XP_012819145.1 transcription factor HIVEP2 [Xenopus tropicalis]|eukprot:XP_012819145.1 PREDICTED: transcription factor HIVEP2 [Xenopus tropicalis]
MESGDSILGQEATSRSRDPDRIRSRWTQDSSPLVTRNTYSSQEREIQPQIHSERIGNPQHFSSLKVTSQIDTAHIPEKQYTQKRHGSYTPRHSHSFPQHTLHQQRLVHSAKSLEVPVYQFHSHLQPVPSEDLFFQMHGGQSASFSRKKISGLSSTYSQYSQKSLESSEDSHKKEQKPKKPGKYICPYCTRACAKPSVLKKHIRSHTGERPYPCVPCGFSFKTKSNLYKHRKSHAHAIKAGLVPFTDSAVSRLDLDAACIDVETEIHSDGEQSTDTDDDLLLGPEKSSPIQLDLTSRSGEILDSGFHTSSEESSGGPIKVPILIIPKPGSQVSSENSTFISSDLLANHVTSKADESHTVRQKLALKLTENKGQNSEKSSNLLSPHSKGSTDSGYFSRSESAEQPISPPNTNATSYEEIMFGKFCRPRSSLTSQEANLSVVNPSMTEENISQLITKRQNVSDPSKFRSLKSSRFTGFHTSEFSKNQLIADSAESENKLYSEIQAQPSGLLAAGDASTLTRSNSMPTCSGTNLSIPPNKRGSHSFDERITGSDDVFYPGTGGNPHQRFLRRQGAFELAGEGHSEFDPYARVPKNAVFSYHRKTAHEKNLLPQEKKMAPGERGIYDLSISAVQQKRWDDFEAYKQGYRESQFISGIKSGEFFIDVTAPPLSRFGITVENRKRRKEKSVGDEEDIPMGCSLGSPMHSDLDIKSQLQEIARGGLVVSGQEYPYSGSQEPFDIASRFHHQSGSPISILDESSLDPDKNAELVSKKPPGNVISVIQHTNSLSRPNSFERSESTELLACQQDKPSSPSEACDSGNTMSSISPEWTQSGEIADTSGRPSPSQQSQQSAYHMPPRLVRQHNITVPEIRVTEEPDKPEKEPEIPVKEPEKPPEEFQWPQRSETLSQLPAEKLPPKKKRLRLADMDNSSGESSFDSTGTSLSRSPSQESNLSHSSSFSMSFDREEILKVSTFTKQDEIKQAEFLTVPPGSYSLSVPGQPHHKEMRRSSSEQIPCPSLTEIPEIRSKSFDYGNLTHASASGATTTTLSPNRERKKCFLVRQASFSGFPENTQTEQETAGNQEPSEQTHICRRSSQIPWHHSPPSSLPGSTSVLSEDTGNVLIGTSAQPTTSTSSHYLQSAGSHDPLLHQTPYIPKRHLQDQQSTFIHPEKTVYPPVHNAFQLPYSSVCMAQLPIHHPFMWPTCVDPLQRHFEHHLQQLQKTYFKQPSQSTIHSYYLDPAQELTGGKPVSYLHGGEKGYHAYLETSAHRSKNTVSKLQRDHSGGSSDSTDQSLQIVSVSQSTGSLQTGTVVPVRIHTHVPSYGSVMYTSISQILVTHAQTSNPPIVICKVDGSTSQRTLATNASMKGFGFSIAQMLGPCGAIEHPIWKVPPTFDLDSAIPLCLASNSDSVATFGGGKRMLSPASSLELFMETKQQKRVKEERMYGQIVKELSAVELTNSDIKKDLTRTSKPQLVRQGRTTEQKDNLPSIGTSSPPLSSDSPQSILLDVAESKSSDSPEGRMSPDELYDEETASNMSLSPQSTPSEFFEEDPLKSHKPSVSILDLSLVDGATIGPIKDGTELHNILQFPSLRTLTTVSWCFLNYAKPSHVEQATLKSSVYASWCISSCNPNPSGLNTRTSLALLRSKQKNTVEIYTVAAMNRFGAGKLTSSNVWKHQFAQMKLEASLLVSSKLEKKVAGISKERTKGESHGEKDISAKQTEPMRIKIFEGGFKSNEDYVYVRGRGRGKYICEECGIRCKKPSMLKKHIRTHTDVRPYVCKLCNFAFKTKGNLTKHMKSKAHMKKCLELGVAMTSVDDADAEESGSIEDTQKDSEKSSPAIDHQFSDAEESDVDDGDDNEDEDDDDEDFDDNQGDITPKTRSRSTSPQPPRFSTLPVTATLASQRASPETSIGHSSLMSYLSTMPSIQITHLMTKNAMCGDSQMMEYQRLFLPDLEHDRGKMDVPVGMDEDFMLTSEPSSSPKDFSSCSRHSSPGYDSSPCRDNSPKRYLSLRGDMSPRRHLSPRRDASPLRHLSPRKEAAIRRELSPRRDVSPRRHLSPLRPVSPGKDLSSGRDISPRRERKYMATFRALSPRRRLHHNSSLPITHYLHSDSGFLGQGRRNWPQVPYTSPHPETILGHQSPGQTLEAHRDYVFSHLPLHSQQQVRAPLPMIPIGGIQMIHSNSTIQSSSHSSATHLHERSSDEKRSMSLESCPSIPLHLDEHSSNISLKDSSSESDSTCLPSLGQSPTDESSQPTEREQEENIRTCTKAIACLRIATEDGLPQKRDLLSRPPEPNQKTSECSQLGIRHFSGLEAGTALASASTTHVDLHGDKDSFGTSQSTAAHSKFYSKTMDMKKLGFHGRKDEPSSMQEVKDTAESSKPH